MSKSGKKFYEKSWKRDLEMKLYGPASRHVRRLMFKILKEIKFKKVVDVGCGAATLLNEISKKYPKASLTGIECARTPITISKKTTPQAKFYLMDIAQKHLNKRFDLVLCVDVLEHIPQDVAAMKNLRKMTSGFLMVVVPLGPLFEIEKKRVGHVHGYSFTEFNCKLEKAGFEIVKSLQWGFPFYNLYRRLLHHLPSNLTRDRYGFKKRLISKVMYFILFLNIISRWGERYFVLCKPK